jgi:two-component system nitrate/nitrite sensor histidine kinase NarX
MELTVRTRRGGIATKLVGIALAFLVAALAAIGMTLLQSWKLQGAAAAINDMGSERMRSYRMVLLVSERVRFPQDASVAADLRDTVQQFESTLAAVKHGDPARPIALPADPAIAAAVTDVELRWLRDIRPVVGAVLADPVTAGAQAEEVRRGVEPFVAAIDKVVTAIERDNASITSWLRSFQMILLAAAVLGTVALVYLLYLLVVRPVSTLQEGIVRLAAEDFGARVNIDSDDEFGALGRAFNVMAENLQNAYTTLEARVDEKTRSLEIRNRELATLFDATTVLNEAADAEALCNVFLKLTLPAAGATAGAVRLREPESPDLHVHAAAGLPEGVLQGETCEHARGCACGLAAERDQAVVENHAGAGPRQCTASGFHGVAVFPIRHERQVLGVFTLFFREPRLFSAREQRLFTTLGQQLGAALQALRLRSMEREVAVSEERNLLARELHDSIAQSLAFLNLQAQMLEESLRGGHLDEARAEVGRIREGVQESYDDVRELLLHFRLRMTDSDLAGALRQAISRFESHTAIRTTFKESGSGIEPDPDVQVQILHVIQEALSNARKHAGASQVEVHLERGPVYRFIVRDDGCGFDPDRSDASGRHVGLAIMRERAHRIHAALQVRSVPGAGTEVVLSLPVAPRELREAAA